MLGKDVRIKKSLLMCGIIPSSNVEGGWCCAGEWCCSKSTACTRNIKTTPKRTARHYILSMAYRELTQAG
jgi:hypothetical protein